jgi:hypothetical protein
MFQLKPVTKMITKYPWFGPKQGFGWGWTPITWEGWTVTGLSMAAVVAAYLIFGPTPIAIYVALGSVCAMGVTCLLTGTPPG